MKNLAKSVLVALTVSVFAIPAFAGEYMVAPVSVQDTVVKIDTVVKEDVPVMLAQVEVTYTKVELSTVPEMVMNAAATKFEGYTVGEAAKGSDNSYKLVIRKGEESKTVYFSETGGFLKEEAAVGETVVLV